MEKNEIKLIRGLIPTISVPIGVTFSFVVILAGIVFNLFDWESKKVLFFFIVGASGILSVVSWINYITGYINYLDARKKLNNIITAQKDND